MHEYHEADETQQFGLTGYVESDDWGSILGQESLVVGNHSHQDLGPHADGSSSRPRSDRSVDEPATARRTGPASGGLGLVSGHEFPRPSGNTVLTLRFRT